MKFPGPRPFASREGTITQVESYLDYQDSLFNKLVNTIVESSGGVVRHGREG